MSPSAGLEQLDIDLDEHRWHLAQAPRTGADAPGEAGFRARVGREGGTRGAGWLPGRWSAQSGFLLVFHLKQLVCETA